MDKAPTPKPGKREPVQILDSDWEMLERAYGRAIPPAARKRIESSTDTLKAGIWWERSAAPVEPGRRQFRKVRDAAAKLKSALPSSQEAGGVDWVVYWLLKEVSPSVHEALTSLINACDYAL